MKCFSPDFAFVFCLLLCLTGIRTAGIAQGTSSKEGDLLIKQVTALVSRQKNNEAIELLERATRRAKAAGDFDFYLKALNRLAALAQNTRREGVAFKAIKEALPVFDSLGRKDLDVAELNYDAGFYFYYNSPSEIDASLSRYAKARDIRISLLGEMNEMVAKCFFGLGDVYRYLKYDYLEAEKNYERALAIREHIGLNDVFTLATNYYNLATTNREQGDHEKAIAYAMKAADLVKKTGDPGFLERTYSMIANIYRDMGMGDQAKEYYRKAVFLHPHTGEAPGILATCLTGLGQTYLIQKDYSEALVNFRKADALYNKAKAEDQLHYIVLLQYMAETFLAQGDKSRFLATSSELIAYLKHLKLAGSRQSTEALERVGRYYYRLVQPDSALVFYQRALMAGISSFHSAMTEENPTLGQIGMDYYIQEVLKLKAQALRMLYETRKEPELLKQAVDCLLLSEKLLSVGKNLLDLEISRWKFADSNFSIYEEGIAALYELSLVRPADSVLSNAFYFFERSRSQSLTQAVSMARQSKTGIADSLLRLQENYKKAMFSFQDLLSEESSRTSPDESSMNRWRQEIVSLDRKMEQNKRAIGEKYPGYFRVEFNNQVPALAEIQRRAAEDDCVLLEYFWGSNYVYALGVAGKGILFKRIERTETVRTPASALIAHLTSDRADVGRQRFLDYRDHAYTLGALLVEPFNRIIPASKRIRISPDGLISQVPFEALLEGRDQPSAVGFNALEYLVKRYDISYLYSSGLFATRAKRTVGQPSILAIGFSADSLRGPSGANDIRGSRKELEVLSKRFGSGEFLTGDKSTEGNFKKLAPNYDILHLAVHGKGDVDKNYSASLFFQAEPDSPEDGELHAYELYGLKLNARMAVLSSCESGLGTSYRGEGMVSMASAFTYSGCQNILMGLWKVPDQTNVQLMDNFYRELLLGTRIDLALSNAKRAYLAEADELTADPRMWAPLVTYGDQLPVVEETQYSLYIVVGVATALLVLFITIRIRKRP